MNRSANFLLRLELGMLARVRHAACPRVTRTDLGRVLHQVGKVARTDERKSDRTDNR